MNTVDAVKKHLEETKTFLIELRDSESEYQDNTDEIKKIKTLIKDAKEFLGTVRDNACESESAAQEVCDSINNINYSCEDVEYSLDAVLKKLEGKDENDKKEQ